MSAKHCHHLSYYNIYLTIRLVFLVLACVILPGRLPALSYYVSPIGDDGNPGTISAPFATITGARDAIRALKSKSGLPAGGIYVWLAGGTYNQSTSIQFEAQDSGTAACPITYLPEAGQQVYITGGLALDPSWFAPVDNTSPVWLRLDPGAQGNVYAANLAAHGITDYGTLKPGGYLINTIAPMELFCNDRPMTLGRWPNADQPFASTVAAPSPNQITYSGTRPSRWSQARDVWLHGFWENTFSDYHVPVTNIDASSQTITFQNAGQFNPAADRPYYAYNLLEEIDQPGEYYIDRTAGIIYFWPPGPVTSLSLQLSMMEPSVVRFDGAEYITLSDLNFEVSRGPLLMINAGDHIRAERCRFRNSGEYAVQILGSNNGLDQCEIVDCGEDGVRMAGGSRASLTAGNNYVTNCRIHQVARINWGCHPGINFFDGCGDLAANNLIDEVPHLAILFAGNNQIIQYNEIRHVCLLTSDSGAIYSGRDWGYRGNRIQFNYLHHIASSQPGYGTSGVYLDDLMSSATVTGNIFYDVSGGAIFCGGGRDNIMTNNIIAGCGMAHYNGDYARPEVSNATGSSWNLLQRLAAEGIQYQQDPWASAYPACAAIPNSWAQIETGLWRNPQGCVFNSNAGWANTNWMVETDVSGTGVFAVYASIANNNPAISPLFDDAAALDRSLRPAQIQAPVTGSQPIPFGSIGRNTQGQPAPTLAPPVPNLTSGMVTNSEVDLNWTDYGNLPCEQEAGFELQRRNEPNGAWQVVASLGPDVDFCTSTGLVPSTVYSYRVRAFNAVGSVFSNSVTVTTLGPDFVPGVGTPVEAESSMTILTNMGIRGNIGVVYAALASRQSVVSLFDPGDAVQMPFNVPVTGTYRLGVRLRAGDSNVPLGTSYWPNGYSFNLDGNSLLMIGDPSTLSPPDNSMGTVYWGTMDSGAVTLNAGEHTLNVVSNHLWAALDYMEVDPFVPPPPPVTFASWQQIHFSADQITNANISGWAASPAGDGLSNLFKYALGLDPWTAATGSGVQISTAGGEPQLSYSRPVGLTDVTYAVEVSNDQMTWTALPQIDLGVNDGLDTEQATDGGPPHLFIRLRIVSGMGASSTPALPAGSVTTRFEAESPLTVVTDLSNHGTVGASSDSQASGGQFVRLFDAGDAIRVNFLSGFGTYRINVRIRAGDAGGQTDFWPYGYNFTLDGNPLILTGDSTTLSPPDPSYPTTYWGTLSAPTIPLSAGMHSLQITANRNWAMVDYVEIISH